MERLVVSFIQNWFDCHCIASNGHSQVWMCVEYILVSKNIFKYHNFCSVGKKLTKDYLMILSNLNPTLSAILFDESEVKMVDVTFMPNSLQISRRLLRKCSAMPLPRYASSTTSPNDDKYSLTPYMSKMLQFSCINCINSPNLCVFSLFIWKI